MTLPATTDIQGLPAYRRIARQLQDEIQRRMRPGDQIAPEHDLAGRFLVNRHTIRRAIDVLADEGILVRQHGRGTYVTEAPIDYSIGGRTRFTENLEHAGCRAVSHVLERRVIPAEGGVAERLKLREGEDVIWLESLRLADDKPFCVASQFLPFADVPDVLTSYHGGSLHQFIDERYGYSLRRTYSLITATMPLGSDAARLMMPLNQPVLRVKSVNVHPQTQAPVEYSVTRFRADRLQLRLDLEVPNEQNRRQG